MNELTIQTAPELLAPAGEYQVGVATLRTEHQRILAHAATITAIANEDDQKAAVAAGRLVQGVTKEVTEFYKGYKSKIDAVKKVVLDDERADAELAAKEKSRLGTLVLAYEQAQEKRRKEEERLAREQAQREAEEQRLQEAIALEAQGYTEDAEAVLNESAMPVPVIAQKITPVKPTGQVTRTKYSGKVVDFHRLVMGVAQGKVPLQALEVNQSFVNSQANDYREALDWPGVTVEKSVNAHFRL